MLAFRIAIEFFANLILAASAEVAVITIVSFVAPDFFYLGKAWDVFVLPALGTSKSWHSGMVGFPLADTHHGVSSAPFLRSWHFSGSFGFVSCLGVDLVVDNYVGVLLQLLDHAFE